MQVLGFGRRAEEKRMDRGPGTLDREQRVQVKAQQQGRGVGPAAGQDLSPELLFVNSYYNLS